MLGRVPRPATRGASAVVLRVGGLFIPSFPCRSTPGPSPTALLLTYYELHGYHPSPKGRTPSQELTMEPSDNGP